MSRVARIVAIAACGLAPAGCPNWMPSLDFTSALRSGPATAPIEVQSEPPGAEAKSSTGSNCRTPCTLQVPADSELSVSFALEGYLPQTVTVRPLPAPVREIGAPSTVGFEPSPVFAQLEAVPPPKGKKKRPGAARTSSAARPAAAPAQ